MSWDSAPFQDFVVLAFAGLAGAAFAGIVGLELASRRALFGAVLSAVPAALLVSCVVVADG